MNRIQAANVSYYKVWRCTVSKHMSEQGATAKLHAFLTSVLDGGERYLHAMADLTVDKEPSVPRVRKLAGPGAESSLSSPYPVRLSHLIFSSVGLSQYNVWLRTGRLGFDPRQRQSIFPVTSASRPDLGPTPPPIQWVPGALSRGVECGRGVMLTTHHLLVPRLRK
jgi:hypothetical protein